MFGDHYPYALSDNDVKSIVNHSIDNYEIDRTPFIIYNSKITSREFNEYTSFVNIAPTLANLFNLDYDSRLYMGEDLLSPNYNSFVVFADGSWKNDKYYYDASTGKVKCYKTKCNKDYIVEINKEINNKIEISRDIITTHYFDYLKEKINK